MASSGSHLLLVALTFAGMDGGRAALHKFYAGTMSCPKLAWLSLVMHLSCRNLDLREILGCACLIGSVLSLLVAMPFAPSSILVPSSKARSP